MKDAIPMFFKIQKKFLTRLFGFKDDFAETKPFCGSSVYWESRYKDGGDSGVGSYGYLARYKANVINTFIDNKEIKTVVEFGCGDGNQLSHYNISQYIGIDVSKTVIGTCQKRFQGDPTKKFYTYSEFKEHYMKAACVDLTLSVDVLYHLVEDAVFESYLHDLFYCSKRFVIIYSTNFDRTYKNPHQVDRHFTPYILERIKHFQLVETIVNPHKGDDTMSDFYIYRKTES